MRLLLAAPEICTPWTEGRKLLVSDLAEELSRRDDTYVLTSHPQGESTNFSVPFAATACGSKLCHLVSITLGLRRAIHSFSPDIVCSFPYGSFRGLYWYANTFYMTQIDRLSRRHNVPCLTVMYSIDEFASPERLQGLVSHLAAGQNAAWAGHTIDMGIKTDTWPERPADRSPTATLLFMAGMWKASRESLDYVLEVRGLRTLLEAGEELSKAGLSLVIAIPLLESSTLRNQLLSHPANTWPLERIRLRASVSKPDVYWQSDLFVFPYLTDITQFIPTSVIESMLAGTPVVMSDVAAFKRLSNDGQTGFLFRRGDPRDLAKVVQSAIQNRQHLASVAVNAQSYVKTTWSIGNTADQLREVAQRILTAQR